MRMSCNGCRVLRKGCGEDCIIRPCLQWINSSDSQANATLFLAKFYGRAGLVNLIEAGPLHLRPAIFRSLLYEACGRIVNPVYGSVGLLWSGNWTHCQAAVDSVLKGSQIVQFPSSSSIPFDVSTPAPHSIIPLFKTCDLRHVSKKDPTSLTQHIKVQNRARFKRSATRTRPNSQFVKMDRASPGKEIVDHSCCKDDESLFSVETVEGSLMNRVEPDRVFKFQGQIDDNEDAIDLNLSLGLV